MARYTLADLEKADRYIADGERHVSRQKALIARLRLIGISTTDAQDLLRLLVELLALFHQHRTSIVTAIYEAK